MENLLMGIDIGTSACKVTLFNRRGTPVAAASETYATDYPKQGWAEQNPDDWWTAVCKALKSIWNESSINPASVAGVGIDGQSWAAVAVDKDGGVLCPSPLWMDTRAADICAELDKAIGKDNIYSVCGNPLQPTYTTPKILWIKKNLPDVYSKAEFILQSNSFIVYRLTGGVSQDLSQGYGLHCFNLRKGVYEFDLCGEMGIKKSLLPEVVPCHHVVGTVTKAAAAACGTLGAGVLKTGQTQIQGGQAGGMSICTDKYNSSPKLITGFHVVPGHWLVQGGTVGGGGVLRWFRDEFSADESFDTLTAPANDVNAGSDGLVFLPYMAGERSPIWDEKAKGVYYGLDYTKTKAHFVRAAMEGVAFSVRHNIEVAENAGAYAKDMYAMGGAANSPLWMQIKADILKKQINVPSSDTATTLGAAMLAGIATGIYNNFDEAVSETVSVKHRYEPDGGNFGVYDKNYKMYRQLYEQLSIR